jgi:methyltransferase (TIGR00027 family)
MKSRAMQIFAVDHPASLAWTQARLREHRFIRPSNLTYVPVDLEDRRLGEQLAACGFNPQVSSFCSALGVIQYLDRNAIDALFEFVSTLNAGSEIVFSFAPPDDELNGDDLDAATAGVARTAALGEPWKSRLRANDLVERLTQFGFRDIYHLTPNLAQQRYFGPRHILLRPPSWEQLIAAVV